MSENETKPSYMERGSVRPMIGSGDLNQERTPSNEAGSQEEFPGKWKDDEDTPPAPKSVPAPTSLDIAVMRKLLREYTVEAKSLAEAEKATAKDGVKRMRLLYNRTHDLSSAALTRLNRLIAQAQQLTSQQPESVVMLKNLGEQLRHGQVEFNEKTVELKKAQKTVEKSLDDWRDRTLIMTREADAKWSHQLALQKLQQDNFNLELVGNIGLLKGVQTNGRQSFIAVGVVSGLTSTALTLMMGAVAYAVVLN